MILDDATDFTWSFFSKTKKAIAERAVDFVKKLTACDTNVKYIRCDDAPENKQLEKALTKAGFGNIQFEYTTPGTPQYNGRIERRFATLYSRVRALLNAAELPESLRGGLWAEAAARAEEDENIAVTRSRPVPAYTQFYENEMPGIRNRHAFGEMAIVSYGGAAKMLDKSSNKGRPCIYSCKHSFIQRDAAFEMVSRSRQFNGATRTHKEPNRYRGSCLV